MSRFEPEALTADAVRAYREETGAGMMEAKNTLIRENLRVAIDQLELFGTLEDKIDFLLNRYKETLERRPY